MSGITKNEGSVHQQKHTRNVRPHTAVRSVLTSVQPFFEDEVCRTGTVESEEPGEQENTFVFEVRVELFVSDFQFLSSNILPERR